MEKASITNLYQTVDFLTGISPFRNYEHPVALDRVAAFIYEKFAEYECEVSYQDFKAGGETYRNVIGTIGPKDTERIILGAHYDVAGNQPGADDNASAVAGLLESARILSLKANQLKQRIDFVAYSLEEPPFFSTEQMGSFIHAKSLMEKKVRVSCMVCYEMIGYFSDLPGSQQYPDENLKAIYPDKGNFLVVVGIEKYQDLVEEFYQGIKKYAAIPVEKIAFPSAVGFAGMSDQRNYWTFDYPAIMINDTSFLRNPNYHQITDTIATLDFEKMAEVVNGVNGSIMERATDIRLKSH